jgi:hypothetical protein
MLVAVNANQDLLHTGVTLDFFSIQSISAGISFFLGGGGRVGGWVGGCCYKRRGVGGLG